MVWTLLVQEAVNAEVNMAMETMRAQNPALFFSSQTSQDGPIVKWLLELRKNKGQGVVLDDAGEDMGTDHSKRPRRSWQPRLRCHDPGRPRVGPRVTAGGVHDGGSICTEVHTHN